MRLKHTTNPIPIEKAASPPPSRLSDSKRFSDEPIHPKLIRREAQWREVSWLRITPFILMHLGCLAVIWVGWTWLCVALAVALYVGRMFFITGFYHRYFSHRAFRAGRFFQLLMAVAGLTAIQRGPIWWAAHHRHNHRHSDQEVDLHSPSVWGTLWAHMFWFTTENAFITRTRNVPDLMRYPEMVWLDRFDWVVYLGFGLVCYASGMAGQALGWDITGGQSFVWGFLISTVLLYHGTYTINSLAHRFGTRRYATKDDSRNNWWLALVTLGEGWHNNHHHYPGAARQGFFWWEIDLTYLSLLALQKLGCIEGLRGVPDQQLNARRVDLGTPDPLSIPTPGGTTP
jgi:stearoyl-CoA desaturase (delta-9 desaturase)